MKKNQKNRKKSVFATKNIINLNVFIWFQLNVHLIEHLMRSLKKNAEKMKKNQRLTKIIENIKKQIKKIQKKIKHWKIKFIFNYFFQKYVFMNKIIRDFECFFSNATNLQTDQFLNFKWKQQYSRIQWFQTILFKKNS